jgi:hypothetical protein
MNTQIAPTYETPHLTTYGDLKTITKGTLAGTTDSANNFKA